MNLLTSYLLLSCSDEGERGRLVVVKAYEEKVDNEDEKPRRKSSGELREVTC